MNKTTIIPLYIGDHCPAYICYVLFLFNLFKVWSIRVNLMIFVTNEKNTKSLLQCILCNLYVSVIWSTFEIVQYTLFVLSRPTDFTAPCRIELIIFKLMWWCYLLINLLSCAWRVSSFGTLQNKLNLNNSFREKDKKY